MRPNTLVHQQVHHLVIMVTVLEIQVKWEMYNFSSVTILRGQPSDLHFSVAPCNWIFAPNKRSQVAVVETRCPNNHVNKYKYMLTSLLFSVSASSSTCKTCDIQTPLKLNELHHDAHLINFLWTPCSTFYFTETSLYVLPSSLEVELDNTLSILGAETARQSNKMSR